MTDGSRVKKTSGSLVTRTFFPHYEEEQMTVWPYPTTAVKHYSFNGMRIAISKGGVLSYVHGDHLGSSSVETNSSGGESASRTYYAYGSTRSSSGTLQTDRTYTGQKEDSTGLHYYNARYYDSSLGTFLSPDTLVPDPNVVIDYNRFLYVRGNPLKYNDPSGHCLISSGDGIPDDDGGVCGGGGGLGGGASIGGRGGGRGSLLQPNPSNSSSYAPRSVSRQSGHTQPMQRAIIDTAKDSDAILAFRSRPRGATVLERKGYPAKPEGAKTLPGTKGPNGYRRVEINGKELEVVSDMDPAWSIQNGKLMNDRAFRQEIMPQINSRYGYDMVQHGPHINGVLRPEINASMEILSESVWIYGPNGYIGHGEMIPTLIRLLLAP